MRTTFCLLLGLIITACTSTDKETNLEYPEITLPDGFEATMIYSPSENGQGSWVSLTTDGQGRLLTSDQYGSIYRLTLSENGEVSSIDSIQLSVGRAQGMLWTPEALYVSVNSAEEDGWNGSGVYKLTDTNGDDEYDNVETLLELEGNGEHGPHALIAGPDGTDIYLIAGNHTLPPSGAASVLHANWHEDRLYPAILDPRGHANEIRPPGGWIARSSDGGESWEIIGSGFRNAYDIAFNKSGELFTYDSDMEWDLGSPWYRPTRVCHVIPGAEFGWRTGSGKWPAYFPDNLPGILDIGQGSPTGITFAYDADFPDEYRNSLFISDWSFGTIYQVDFQPEGASYSATKKEFLSGTPLAISDVVIGPDGSMYLTTGGRRGTSYLYRVAYTGSAQLSETAPEVEKTAEQQLLNQITSGAASQEELITALGNSDRFIRFAARVALESRPVAAWWDEVKNADNPDALIAGAIGAIRSDSLSDAFDALNSLATADFTVRQQLDLIRAYGLYFIRSGNLKVPGNLPAYPTGNPDVDRQLCELLVYLGDAAVIEPTLDMMETYEATSEAELTPVEVLERSEQYGPTIKAMHENRPAEQGLALAMALSHLKDGWTDDSRNRYFTWFYRALTKSGGMSYSGFVEKVRLTALDNVPKADRARLAELSGESILNEPVFASNVNPPEGPGRNWQLNEARGLVDGQLSGRSFTRGKELYEALLCATCHAMNGQGGNIGPDLTQAGTRFSTTDLLNSMILPSMSVSDQYAATRYKLSDGTTRTGRSMRSTEDTVFISTNPYSRDVEPILRNNIISEEISPVSLMPGGLINALNERELLDLMAYLKAGGNPESEYFQPSE